MKNKLLYSLPLLLALISGCTHQQITPVNVPTGIFAGQFALLHLNSTTGVFDTTEKAPNLNLSLETATGFKVTGDTTTFQAGSYGSYVLYSTASQIDFYDKTYPGPTASTKIHLDGSYGFTYDGTTLQLGGFGPLDTLEYYYKFTRTGN
jgi:hypothetical protein